MSRARVTATSPCGAARLVRAGYAIARGPRVVPAVSREWPQTAQPCGFALVGGTGLEPLPPIGDTRRHTASPAHETAANAAVFTFERVYLSSRGVACHTGRFSAGMVPAWSRAAA